MRNKIDYGIDLGTTNSAIACMKNGIPSIIKTDKQSDTLPSCIFINKKKEVQVGEFSYHNMKADSIRALRNFKEGASNTFIEFKRTMGTTHSYESSNLGHKITPEELSSEILKCLKSFVKEENISSIVITVPAKFLNPQNEATMQAAKLAGFKHIELLQEPVAAATAYGLNTKNKNGFWLVFDFGGGTFDAALIKAEDGILSVKDTDGDNWLGGKNLDLAIVDQIIIPNIQNNYAIDSIIEDTDKKEVLRNAVKFFAEEAKIQLSSKDSCNILSQLGDLPFEDDNGDEPEIDVLVTQKDMERVLGPIFQKAIDITKGLLKRNNLKNSDLGALILVGGPTYSPILRRMLKEQITDKVDTSMDPMTVVAKGAALFASTISVSDEVKEQTRDRTKLQLEINYEATSVELDEIINIKVLKEKTTGTFPDKIYADIVRFDGAWSSGKKLIGEKTSILEVLLLEGKSNSFNIQVYDEKGNKLECQPNQFSILQGIGGLDKMQVLPYHIGIGKYFSSEDKDLFSPVTGLDKNKTVPATGVSNGLKTRSTVRPGMIKDIIRIPIYQGDYKAEGTNPVLNNLITEVIITGENLPALLPENSTVDITIKVDSSQLMKFSAYFPLLNHTEELEIDITLTEPPSISKLTQEISNAKQTAKRVNATGVSAKLETLEKQLENDGGNTDGKLKILDGLRKELLILGVAEKAAEWIKVKQELKETFHELEDLINKIKTHKDDNEVNMDKIEAHIQEYRKSIEYIIKSENTKDAKSLIREIGQLDFDLRNAVTGNAIDVQYLRQINNDFGSIRWKNPNKARQLINQGSQLVTEGKTTAIRPILVQIIELMHDDDKPKNNETLGS